MRGQVQYPRSPVGDHIKACGIARAEMTPRGWTRCNYQHDECYEPAAFSTPGGPMCAYHLEAGLRAKRSTWSPF